MTMTPLAPWRGVMIAHREPTILPGKYGETCWPVRLSYKGHSAHFEIRSGSFWRPTTEHVIGHIAIFAKYAFEDGDPEHGIVPVRDWYESLGDIYPDDDDIRGLRAVAGEHASWLIQASLAAYVLGDLLSDAQEVD